MNLLKVIYLSLVLLVHLTAVSYAVNQSVTVDSLLTALAEVKEDTAKATTLDALFREYFSLNKVQEATSINNKLFALATKMNYKKAFASSLSNFGQIHENKGRIDSAIYFNLEALKIFQETKWIMKQGETSRRIGIIYAKQGDYKKSFEFITLSIKAYEEVKFTPGVAEGTMNIGSVYLCFGSYAKALHHYYKALNIYEKLNDKKGISNAYNNIGNIYASENKLAEALAYYKKGAAIQEELGGQNNRGDLYSNIAEIYLRQNNLASALEYNLKSLAIRQKLNYKQGVIISLSSIGAVYLKQGKFKEAFEYQLQALELAEELGLKREQAEASSEMGKIYVGMGDYDNALKYYGKQLIVAKSINYKESMLNAYSDYASLYRKLNQFDKAYNYMELYHALKDSLLNKENLKQLAEFNTKYETEKKENEISLLIKDKQLNTKIIKQQQLIRWGLLVGMSLLFIAIFSIFKRYKDKQKAHNILERKNLEIEKKNHLITDSIDYAKTIQEAVLPGTQLVRSIFPQHFIFYKPKAIVSGDFYWVGVLNNKLYCAVADCTGHGVPGAFMSLLGYSMLENALNKSKGELPSEILDILNVEVISRLSQNESEKTTKHGMDIALINIDKTNHLLKYAGAHNSLYIVRNNELTILKSDNLTLGADEHIQFTNQQFYLQKGDMIYLFTDGFPDQIGGPSRKKFYYSPFREFLLSISTLDMETQQKKLNEKLLEWMDGKFEQTDDILIMGLRYDF